MECTLVEDNEDPNNPNEPENPNSPNVNAGKNLVSEVLLVFMIVFLLYI